MDDEEDSFFDAPSNAKTTKPPSSNPAAAFDDGGEPDFAGWLAAQNKAKSSRPTPKGLLKTTSTNMNGANLAARPANVRSSSAGPSVAAKTASRASAATVVKKEVPKPKEPAPGEEDDWGAAWD